MGRVHTLVTLLEVMWVMCVFVCAHLCVCDGAGYAELDLSVIGL